MIEHVSIIVSDYAKAKDFYTKALAPLGYHLNMDYPDDKASGFMQGGHTSFWIGVKEPRAASHVAFGAESKEAVDEFYRIAMTEGAKDNGKPGYRAYSPGYYAAFVFDSDGNNIEAVWFDPEKEKA